MTNIISEIPRGSDITVQFTMTDENGAAINLALYAGIAVFLYQCDNKKILAQYSKVSTAGYDDVTVTNAAAGIFEIYVPRSLTAKLKPNELKAEIKLRKVDAGGEGGMMYSVASNVPVDFMTDSIASTVTVP